MITLETGVPGAGKTLYCIDKLLRPLIGASVQLDGVTVPRTIYTNINGLLLDHTKIEAGAEWHHDTKAGWTQGKGNQEGLNNWHQWAKPGAVIVFDEVQKVWPLAAAGSKVPPCIEALETHRHMGVDFIVLTQSPMLVHANLTRLVGRHLHVRRMGNMGFAIVYEWDSCSRTLLYKNSLAKEAWRYDKKVFQLYKSAEVHTKQPRRIPTLVYIAGAALLGLFAIGPSAIGRMVDRINPNGKVEAAAAADAKAVGAAKPLQAASAPAKPASQPVGAIPGSLEVKTSAPAFAGCIRLADKCKCLASSGDLVPVEPAQCLAVSGSGRGPAVELAGSDTLIRASGASQIDLDTLRFLAASKASAGNR